MTGNRLKIFKDSSTASVLVTFTRAKYAGYHNTHRPHRALARSQEVRSTLSEFRAPWPDRKAADMAWRQRDGEVDQGVFVALAEFAGHLVRREEVLTHQFGCFAPASRPSAYSTPRSL